MRCEQPDCTEYAVRTVECTAPTHAKAAKGFCDLHARQCEQGYITELAALFIHCETVLPPDDIRCEHVSHAGRCEHVRSAIIVAYPNRPGTVAFEYHSRCYVHVAACTINLRHDGIGYDILPA